MLVALNVLLILLVLLIGFGIGVAGCTCLHYAVVSKYETLASRILAGIIGLGGIVFNLFVVFVVIAKLQGVI